MYSQWTTCIIVIGIWIPSCKSFNGAQTTVKTYQNNTVVLPCHVDSLDVPIIIRWWREDVLLADSSDPNWMPPPRIKMLDNMSLEVSQIQPKDSGKYFCQALRPAPWGHVTQVHAIEVLYPPSVHSVPEAGELEVNFGDEVEMACIAKGVPFPSISWRMKDEEMKLLDERSKLRFRADNRSLTGRYTCVADNGIGEAATASIDLRIRYKPEIEVKKSWIHASPGIRVQLDCKIIAYPEATVEWLFENESLAYSSRIVKHTSGQTHSLVIRNVRPSDYGCYICRASNDLGTTEGTIELSGIANAAVFKGFNVIGPNAYNFIWEVDSYKPIIEYQFWFRRYSPSERGRDWHKLFIPSGSDAIGPLHSKSFNLTGLSPATHYEALVLSRNRYGWSKPSKVLRFATESTSTRKEHYKVENELEESSLVTVNNVLAVQDFDSTLSNNGSVTSNKIHLITLMLNIVLFLMQSLNRF
ncbi:opioid-binding protein/cell adhesion molecule homolog [Chelonus insularis]|uniref:opioid-binding protein/cell adhesion molecule homolog n=1 Tax=Chelonus insularis TaxID=460826 RepID=UPI00158D8849|nr:opioid-binding protein/cell adhesion molecule homolog [Chelonus insularis]